MSPWLGYVLVGMLAGVFGSLLGVCGGILTVPILALGFGFAQKSAQGMSLAIMVPMALVAALRYRYGIKAEMNMMLVVLMAAGAIAGALVGTELAHVLSGGLLRKVFAVILVIVAVKMFFTPDAASARPTAAAAMAAHGSAADHGE